MEADPSGDAPVRIDNGYPVHVQMLPAYYDGVAMFENENGLVITDKGNKIVIQSKSIYDFIEEKKGSIKQISLDLTDGPRKDSYNTRILLCQKEYDEIHLM